MLKITFVDGTHINASFSDETDAIYNTSVTAIPLTTLCSPYRYGKETLYTFTDSYRIKQIEYLNDNGTVSATVDRKNCVSFAKFFTARMASMSIKDHKVAINYTRLGVIDLNTNINEARIHANGEVQWFTANVAKVVATGRLS